MNDTTKGLIAWAVILAAGIAAGLGIGWKLWSPKAPVVETYAPAVKQPDGSVMLERKPQADAKPAQQIPKGAKVERVVQVTVQPNPGPGPLRPSASDASGTVSNRETAPPLISVTGGNENKPPCLPVRVDLSLIRLQDQSRRVIASSPDGLVVGGVDIPVEAAAPPRAPLKWAAGGSYNPADRTFGAWAERDAGPLRLGVDLHQVREPIASGGRVSWAGMIRAGIRF